jgi:cyanophycinase
MNPGGWLIIQGGGSVSSELLQRFVALAGGRDATFVTIPTALSDSEIERKGLGKLRGTKNHVLHTRDHAEANSARFVEPLRHASGVMIYGGRQWRLVDAYLGTAVEREIKALVARGGVVMGGSAGATIQGSFLVRGAPGTLDNPDGDNTIMMYPGYETGFGLLPSTAIDQHIDVNTGKRVEDLAPVVAEHPELLGIGISEGAAIVVHGDSFVVVGGQVLIHEANKQYYFLREGDCFNLQTRQRGG